MKVMSYVILESIYMMILSITQLHSDIMFFGVFFTILLPVYITASSKLNSFKYHFYNYILVHKLGKKERNENSATLGN